MPAVACTARHTGHFPVSRVYQAHIPTCPSGYWLFGFASKEVSPAQHDLQAEKSGKNLHITYKVLHNQSPYRRAFMLPKYLEDMLEDEEDR